VNLQTHKPSPVLRPTTAQRLRLLLPGSADYKGLRRSWRTDALAGVTVGVVALPLALAFGVTSGVGAAAGLVTAVVAGLVVAVLGGSHLQVTGPTGAMTVVLVPIVARFGPEAVFAVAVLGGLILLLLGLAGFGRAIAYIPWPVVEGFTLGIGVIIFLQQVPMALNVAKPDGENTALVAARAVAAADLKPALTALAVVALVVALVVLLPRLRKTLPASLIAIVIATVVAEIWRLPVARIGALPSSLPLPSLPPMDPSMVASLFPSALAVAALAGIESLLSARVADGMSDTRRHEPDRELFGQGLGNIAAGLFGGVPSTGAIARTAVGVRAGARTRVAAIVHSLLLLGVVYLGAQLVGRIPLAALAGVLMVTAVRMIDRHRVVAVLKATRSDALVLALTCLATIVFDLVVAVEIGVAMAALFALRSVARASGAQAETAPARVEVDDDAEERLLRRHIAVFRLSGALFFGAAQRFLDELTSVADVKVVILRMGGVQVLDATGADALGEIVRDMQSRGITVLLASVTPEHRRLLGAVGALAGLAHERHAFTRLEDAVEHAHVHVARIAHDPADEPVALSQPSS
jgi:SulP family sulfate permease